MTIYLVGVVVAFILVILELSTNKEKFKNKYTDDELIKLTIFGLVLSWLYVLISIVAYAIRKSIGKREI